VAVVAVVAEAMVVVVVALAAAIMGMATTATAPTPTIRCVKEGVATTATLNGVVAVQGRHHVLSARFV
jgi:hypothetical protein